MPNPIDAGSDTYATPHEREPASTPDDHQAAALTPDHLDLHTPSHSLRDDSALAKFPASHDRTRMRGAEDSAEPLTVQHIGIHAMGGAATEEPGLETAERQVEARPHAAQRVGGAALTEAVHTGEDPAHDRMPDAEANRTVASDDVGADDNQRTERESRVPGTIGVTELRAVLDKIATYGVKKTDDVAPPQVDLQALQQRLDDASNEGADTLRLDPADVVELTHLEPQPSQLDKLACFDDSETSKQPVEDRIVTERALSLLPITRREILIRSNPMGGSQDTVTIADRMGKTEGTVQQQRWRAQQDFTQLADGLQQGDLDLKRYGIDHPKSRSPLTLLARLDVDINPNARMEELRETARSALRRTPLNNSQRAIMAHLWGLYPGQQSTSTANVTAITGYRGTSITNIERVMFGLQSTNYHPERTRREER